MKFKGVIEYPIMLHQLSDEMALARWYKNTQVRQSSEEFQRGSKEKELDIESKGILGELIVRYHLEKEKINYQAQVLISETPLKEPDILIKQHRIDVKTSNLNILMVNQNAHLKGKNEMDYYWFVKLITDGLAEYWVYSVHEVDNWEVKQLKYTKAYVKII